MAHGFAGYHVLERLYSSARSSVVRARRVADGCEVVLKQSAGETIAAEAVRRAQHELELLDRLRGGRVIASHGLVREGGHVALVLESFGRSLASRLVRGRIPLAEALDIALDVARGLAQIHAAGVTHKDINPHNLAHDEVTGRTKIIDFDIAHVEQPHERDRLPATAPALLEGTFAYMAPEQTGRLNRAIDGRTDLYSLGVTLHELFCGHRPFSGDDAGALVHAHLAEQPPRLDAIDPAIPSVVADIVARLLAKAPEQRYQTAAGVVDDLERCWCALLIHGAIEPFGIAVSDTASRIELPDRLYGRGVQVRALVDAFERAARGGAEIALVSGYSGMGKSSTVRELLGPVAARRGWFATGKFEQLHREVPYSAVIAALGELVERVLADPELPSWRAAMIAALGDDAGLVHGVLPAIERVLGTVSRTSAAIGADAGRVRVAAALVRLVQVFARREHPLVLFLDDMQWADVATLELLASVVGSSETEALLVIEACRDTDLDPGHPLAIAMRDLDRRGVGVSRISIDPLDIDDTTEMIADAFRRAPADVRDIAAAIWRKTQGNPFFIRRFVQMLCDDGLVAFDPIANHFAVDPAAIERASITDNVADLLARALDKLPARTRDLLVLAAAIGSHVEVATLAIAADASPVVVLDTLAPAIDAGLIAGRFPAFEFQHDRIQQACYEALAIDAREHLHLTIGRRLLAASSDPERLDACLFDIAHHYKFGLGLVEDVAERARFVELAMLAADRARRAGASELAIGLLRAACFSLRWDDTALGVRAHRELAEALSTTASHRDAREVVRRCLPHASGRDRAALEALDITLCTSLGLMADAVACARRAGDLYGIALPADPAVLARLVDAEIAAVMTAVAGSSPDSWLERAEMTDLDVRAAMTMLANAIPAAYQIEPPLLALIAGKLVTLTLRHGTCAESARGLTMFAVVAWRMGRLDVAATLGDLSLALIARYPGHPQATAVELSHAAFVAPWHRPLEASIERVGELGRDLDARDAIHAGYAAMFHTMFRLFRGDRLGEIDVDIARSLALCDRIDFGELRTWLGWAQAHVRSYTRELAGGALDFASLDREHRGSITMHVSLRMLELERRLWRGDHAGVLELVDAIRPMLPAIAASVHVPELELYACLASLASNPHASVTADLAALAGYAASCPSSFGHMVALVEAELARVAGDSATALARYDAAIAGASEHGFLKVETLAHECAARFWIDAGKPGFGAVHLAKARDLCEHRGARARARELELARRALGATGERHAIAATSIANTLDFAAVVKASQAIASDIVLDSLLVKIVDIIVENTGAQTGSIVLDCDGAPSVTASKQSGAPAAITGGVPLARSTAVSSGIVSYVLRTAAPVALADATRHQVFRSDPYVRERRPRSVLCMPIVHKDRAIGAVYLENNLVADAFTIDRLEAVDTLIAQLAISIENALMVSRLEELVATRTRALLEAESELRLAQKLQSVGQLASGIAHEINTPIQFVGNNVSFLCEAGESLLGLVDVYRAARRGELDDAAVVAAEEASDVDYLRANVPDAGRHAQDGVARVSTIVRAMRTFAHPDCAELAPVAINAAIESTLVVARSEYRHVADVAVDFGDLPEVLGHVGELNQVFLNLIVNSAHAIEDVVAGTSNRGTIAIATRADLDDVVVTIADTGGGIPDAIRDRIFDPFFTTKPVGRGTGQGLAISRTAIVDRHGGSLTFVSEPGRGTTFTIRLPLRRGN